MTRTIVADKLFINGIEITSSMTGVAESTYLQGVSPGTVLASLAIVANSDKFIDVMNLLDSASALKLGTGSDVLMGWTGTKLTMLPALDDSVWEIGDGTTSFDVKLFGSVAANFVYWDASADTLQFGKGATTYTVKVDDTTAAATAGGRINITAGTAGTSGTGGVLALTAGIGGTTGTGGALTVTSGAGGTTSGVSGALTVSTGAPAALSGSASGVLTIDTATGATSTTTAGASGALAIKSNAGGATTSNGTGGASGALAISTGVGGAGDATGSGGAGGLLSLTAGNGGAATGAGTGGKGGLIVLTPGAGGTTSGGTAGLDGFVATRGTHLRKLTVTAITDTTTITVAGLRGGILAATPTAAASYTMPTGTVLEAAFPAGSLVAGDSFDFTIVNVATNDSYDITLVTALSGITLYGNLVVEANSATTKASSGIFRAVYVSSNTWGVYRVG